MFVSGSSIYSAGAVVDELPFAISQHADGGYATVGALAAPFGTPMVASTETVGETTTYKLAKFSGYDTACSWRSIVIPVMEGTNLGMIDKIVVLTNSLGADARCDLQLETNQDQTDSGTVKQITGTGKRRHVFSNFGGSIEDFRVYLNWAEGDESNDSRIREIQILGHVKEK